MGCGLGFHERFLILRGCDTRLASVIFMALARYLSSPKGVVAHLPELPWIAFGAFWLVYAKLHEPNVLRQSSWGC